MKKLLPIALLALLISCGDNKKTSSTPTDGDPDMGEPPGDPFVQVEHLARPGINEALIISQDFLNGYNATAPSFAGVPSSVLNQVVNEAKTVLKALYLGGCLLNGVLGLSAGTGVKPAGITCHAVGQDIWSDNSGANTFDGKTLTAASVTAAQAYADKVFGQFIPDVMRVDVTGASNYLTPCNDLATAPLLCGGRFLNDDSIDITFFYLLDGVDSNHTASQFRALTSDGVNFSTTSMAANGTGSRFTFDDTDQNTQQGHPSVSDTFPYSAPPL